jgi:hypothetical protein
MKAAKQRLALASRNIGAHYGSCYVWGNVGSPCQMFDLRHAIDALTEP